MTIQLNGKTPTKIVRWHNGAEQAVKKIVIFPDGVTEKQIRPTTIERPDIDAYSSLYSTTSGVISSPHGIGVSPDGTKLYLGPASGSISQYGMTDGLLQNLSASQSSSSSTNIRGAMYFKEDGSKAFWCSDNQVLYQATMSTPFSFTGSSISIKSISNLGYYPAGIYLSDDGGYVFTVDQDNGKITKCALTNPRDISTFTTTGKQEITVSSYTGDGHLYCIQISPTGQKMFIGNRYYPYIYQFNLSTPRDLTTATYANKRLTVAARGLFAVRKDGKYLFHANTSTKAVTQYTS